MKYFFLLLLLLVAPQVSAFSSSDLPPVPSECPTYIVNSNDTISGYQLICAPLNSWAPCTDVGNELSICNTGTYHVMTFADSVLVEDVTYIENGSCELGTCITGLQDLVEIGFLTQTGSYLGIGTYQFGENSAVLLSGSMFESMYGLITPVAYLLINLIVFLVATTLIIKWARRYILS